MVNPGPNLLKSCSVPDDDLSEISSGRETPASASSRNDLDAIAGDDRKKKKKTIGKKKEKKTKTKKDPEDPDRKKKKGFGLLRFGKKKDDKTKGSKTKLDALSEEELDRIPDRRDSPDSRFAEVHSGHLTPDYEDEDSDPHYARINDFRQHPTGTLPARYRSRSPSPATPALGQRHASADNLEELYAKVQKPRKQVYNDPNQPGRTAIITLPLSSKTEEMGRVKTAALDPKTGICNNPESKWLRETDETQRNRGQRREHPVSRAVPGYDELDAARRRVLEYDPNRSAPRSNELRPSQHYEDLDRQFNTQTRRDPYDYPRSTSDDSSPYDPTAPRERLPLPQSSNQRHQSRGAQNDHRGRQPQQQHDTTRREGHRQASPGRYIDDRYGYDGRQPDPRRKNPVIGAV
ncbi:partitioning defective 3 homolog B-like [Boleophthalmus pectinirostris]|uniref:partitioning defective 3 homolog B-like n=1 Tax=Boleophthalmus pectinirostris TaxID=150288 RepID=UPI0024317531|nr:partitioning defective 3 homolog B-like [Boleophthalmus pectinirostris]